MLYITKVVFRFALTFKGDSYDCLLEYAREIIDNQRKFL